MDLLSFRAIPSFALLLTLGLQAQNADNPFLRSRSLPARTGPNAISGHDRPDLRREWNLFWFGGRPSASFLDHKNRQASQEMAQWGRLVARPLARGGVALLPSAAAPAGSGGTWVSLGPLSNTTQTNPSVYDIDAGRPIAVVPDPNTPTTVYLGTSGGGVFKCTNASLTSSTDWVWTPITDGLSASGSSGNVSLGALALDAASNRLYLGMGDAFDAEGRGFFTSVDGGSSWTPATGLGLATISYDILPLTSSRVFWGTNDGLKVSDNGGASFSAVSGGPGTGSAWTMKKLTASDLVCSMQDSSGAGSIYYSNDAGATWNTTTLPTTGFPIGRISLATSPASTTTVLGICENTKSTTSTVVAPGLLKSTDKGATWTWVTPTTAPFTTFLKDPSNKNDGGDGGQGWYNQMIALDPANADHIFIGANLAAWRSLDGGNTWAQLTHWYGYGRVYSHADFHAATWSGDGKTLFMSNDGGLSILRDPFRASIPSATGGVTSDPTFLDNRRNKGVASHLVYNVGATTASSPADSKWRISLGMQDDGTRIRQPNTVGGSLAGTETAFDDMIGGDGFSTLINPADGTKILGSIYYTDIWRSTDGGGNFSESISGITEANSSSKAPFQPRLAQGNTADTVYTATNGTVYKSTNFGSSWTALPRTGLPTAGTSTSTNATYLFIRNLAAAAGDPNALGLAANQGRVYLSYSGGSSWAQAGALPNNGFSTSSLCFHRTNSQIVYVTSVASDATVNHIWKSTNGGTSWAAIDGTAATGNGLPFGIPIHVVETDPVDGNKVYVGTDFGVYYSTNAGTSWSRFGSNLPLVAVRDLYIAPDGSFLRAATFGRGVWELQTASAAGPVVAITAPAASSISPGATIAFTATAVAGATGALVPTTYTWAWGDGTPNTTGTLTASHVFRNATKASVARTVTFSASDASGAQSSATVSLTVKSALDLNGDGVIDHLDLLWFAKYYGQSTAAALAAADFDGNGAVDDADLAILLAAQ